MPFLPPPRNRHRRYVRQRPTAVVARQKTQAVREARQYATGKKRMPTQSPRSRREYGDTFPPKAAARQSLINSRWHWDRATDRNASHLPRSLRGRRAASGKRTSTGGRWTLAGNRVGRDPRGSGKFVSLKEFSRLRALFSGKKKAKKRRR